MRGLDDFPRDEHGRVVLPDAVLLRFWRFVDRRGQDECWEWQGGRFHGNHGAFKPGRETIQAHRVSYAFMVGPIPDDLCVLHTCSHAPCVNPGHLRLGTKKENVRQSVAEGRWGRWLSEAHRPTDYVSRGPREVTAEERFWRKVRKTEYCWEWTGASTGAGYGSFRGNGKNVGAHRFAYEQAYGPIPTGLFVRHLCNNPPCVRPEHLAVGTQTDNMRDLWEGGRRHGKITQEQANEMVALYESGSTMVEIGGRFGVAYGSVHLVVRDKNRVYSKADHPVPAIFRNDRRTMPRETMEGIRAALSAGMSIDAVSQQFKISRKRAVTIRSALGLGKPKLSDDQVRRVRQRYAAGTRTSELASEYDVTPHQIWGIATGRSRKSVTP